MTSSITQKYTHPRAYFPDCDHGSTVFASTSPGGLLLLQHGIFMRFSNCGRLGILLKTSRSTRVVASSRLSRATPALFARSSTRAGIAFERFLEGNVLLQVFCSLRRTRSSGCTRLNRPPRSQVELFQVPVASRPCIWNRCVCV